MIIKTLKQTCKACPSQWEGTLDDGRIIYIRYRSGFFSISVADSMKTMFDNHPIITRDTGDWLDGYMSEDELSTILDEEGIEMEGHDDIH